MLESGHVEVGMFHLGDIVQEVATGRRGKIDNLSQNHDAKGEVTSINYWRVFFEDGKQPLFGMVSDPEGIRLVSCPHGKPEASFHPARGIMG
jgi:hypothetical protein